MLNDNDNWDDNVVQCSCCVDDEEVVNQTLSASSPSDNDSGNDGDDEGAEDVQDGDYDGEEDNVDGDDDGNDGDDEGETDVQDGDYDASRNVILTPSTRRLFPPQGSAIDCRRTSLQRTASQTFGFPILQNLH